jgi:NTE family protein
VISRNTVGLVLSGGGARGFAHLGVMRALEEAGVAYDLVAGTSFGAVMAAYAGMDIPARAMIDAARYAFRESPTGDYNIVPLISLISGNRLRRVIDSAVVDSRGQHIDIEDLWKGYFCVTSNYSAAREAVHTRGPLAKSIRASVSIPGALPPVMLDGELHIDGGTFNNFPTDVMDRRGAARIIGVDLLRDRGLRYEIDEVPGALELMRDTLRGRARRYRLPSLTTLLLNTSLMYSYARQQEAQSLVDLHFAPSVYTFGMLDWWQFDKIVDAGYRHGVEQLDKLGDAAVASYRYR